jgi:hypothetical protein
VAAKITISREMTAPDDALYFEESLEGIEVIRENRDGIESRVDLGLLFGFVTKEQQKARTVLLANAGGETP